MVVVLWPLEVLVPGLGEKRLTGYLSS